MLATDDFVNGGITAAAVLAILMVPLSTFGRRWRHPAVRFLAWSTSIVFLPLTSSVIFSLLDRTSPELTKQCGGPAPPTGKDNPYIQDMWTLLLWVVVILTIKTNVDADAAAAVASTDGGHVSVGDGQRLRPPIENLAQYAWVAFLIWLCVPRAGWLGRFHIAVFIAFTALGLVKMALKLAAFRNASHSFALGKNTSLIAGHMAQLVTDGGGANGGQVPRYIVMGETERHVEESTHGYRIKRDVLEDKFSSLVTLDRVWLLAEHGDGILARRPELRDLCLSYSLFKILRRRLSGYRLAEAGSGEALNFVLRGMDRSGAGGVNSDRMFRVVADELWFASDFYYTRTPLCILGGWLATLSYLCSVLIIVGAIAVAWFYEVMDVVHTTPYKVITFYLLHAVVFVEIWEIAAGVRSKWTKMALLGHYIRHESAWRRSSFVHAALRAVLRVRKPRRWRHEMGQSSVLEPRRFLRWTGRMRSVEVSPAVRDAVVRSLLSTYGRMSNGGAVALRVGGKIDWELYGSQRRALDGDGGSTTELILTWHVATRLFEMKVTSASADMIAACQLSYYCAYLVAAAPELLPDSVAWTEKRYREVTADVRAAVGKDAGSESAAGRYERLMEALSAVSRDIVLQRGAELGRHLVEQYAEDEASACRILADFWSEMVLYVAPSENVKGHVEAMARGGEFITLVWALLLHAGVTTRPDTRDGSIP